jgi:hypothetical protein
MTEEEYWAQVDLPPGDAEGATARAKAVMATYGENRWWLSDDPRERAYFQLHEDILLTNRTFFEDIAALVGHDVYTHDLTFSRDILLAEAEAAWRGTPYSEEGREQAQQEYAEHTKRWIQDHPEKVHIVLDDEEEDR